MAAGADAGSTPASATVLAIDSAVQTEFEGALAYHKDFPIAGVTFVDFFPVFKSASLVKKLVAELCKVMGGTNATGTPITHIAGLDSRGFMLGPMIAAELGLPFVPIRKEGKLPGKCLTTEYSLEYGSAGIEVQESAVPDGAVFAVVDDLLATGGTMGAAVGLLREAGATVACAHVAISLSSLGGASKIGCPCFTIASVSDEEALARADAAGTA